MPSFRLTINIYQINKTNQSNLIGWISCQATVEWADLTLLVKNVSSTTCHMQTICKPHFMTGMHKHQA